MLHIQVVYSSLTTINSTAINIFMFFSICVLPYVILRMILLDQSFMAINWQVALEIVQVYSFSL